MGSRFVSTGAIDPTSGHHVEAEVLPGAGAGEAEGSRNKEAWEAVQKEVAEERRRREAEKASGEPGKSLYDVLQENKAAKQAAFEEKTALRNQFRALDDDEVEFLDDVRQSKRAEEERLRRETEEGLKAFREAQKSGGAEASGKAGEGEEEIMEDWGAGRKRKRREREVKGVKRRVSSGAGERNDSVGEGRKESAGPERKGSVEERPAEAKGAEGSKHPEEPKKPEPEKKPKLGLVDYGSDESE